MTSIKDFPSKLKKPLKLAKAISGLSDYPHYKLGAVIFDNHKVYACACNSDKTTPLQKEFNKFKKADSADWKHSAHAEVNCIHKLLQQYYQKLPNVKYLSLLVYREKKNGSFAMAKPCPACEAAIKKLGIKNVYYTGNDSVIHEIYSTNE